MWTIFRHGLRRSRGQILGWGLALAVLGAWIISLYPTILSMWEQYRELLKSYPPEMLAFFGGVTDLTDPVAYLDFVFFSYMPIVVGIYAWGKLGILLGAAALFALLGWALFARRDIRVGGEAGWRLPGAHRPEVRTGV